MAHLTRHSQRLSGAEKHLDSGRGKASFLTSSLIELIEGPKRRKKAQSWSNEISTIVQLDCAHDSPG